MLIKWTPKTEVSAVSSSTNASQTHLSGMDNDKPLLSFKDKGDLKTRSDNSKQDRDEKSDKQQLVEDSVWLAELWEGLQIGEPWAIEEAKKLSVADDPDKDDKSENAQLLRSNNELARAILSGLNSDTKKEDNE